MYLTADSQLMLLDAWLELRLNLLYSCTCFILVSSQLKQAIMQRPNLRRKKAEPIWNFKHSSGLYGPTFGQITPFSLSWCDINLDIQLSPICSNIMCTVSVSEELCNIVRWGVFVDQLVSVLSRQTPKATLSISVQTTPPRPPPPTPLSLCPCHSCQSVIHSSSAVTMLWPSAPGLHPTPACVYFFFLPPQLTPVITCCEKKQSWNRTPCR